MPWPAASLAGAFPSLGVVLTVHSYSLAILPRLAAAKWRVLFGEDTCPTCRKLVLSGPFSDLTASELAL